MRAIIYLAIMLSLAMILGCGQKGSPQGGPKDTDPPAVTQVLPKDSTLNFDGKLVRFYFSEPIRKPTYGKEIFISPFTERPKIILSDNAKRLSIEFQEDLRPQTTYLITLTEVKDLHESNPLAEPYILAFSTGDQLDSMEIKGKLFLPSLVRILKKMTVLLFDSDSIQNQDFFLKRPAYLTQSNESGEFSFKYLRNTNYKILAVKDDDSSNSLSSNEEAIAIPSDSLLQFEDDSTNFTTVSLYFFPQDVDTPG